MSLTRSEFAILDALASADEPLAAEELVSKLAGSDRLTEAGLREAHAACAERGLLRNGEITSAGLEALEPYRVRTAVIMAAGRSTRVAPLSFDTPKSLVRVRGERIIERQLRQLFEAGITEVYVIVGYKAEQFAYLEEKFGVHLIFNEYFLTHDFGSSNYLAREHLHNSYLLYADVYYPKNPFHRYQYESWCAVRHKDGPSNEWAPLIDDEGYLCGWDPEPGENRDELVWFEYYSEQTAKYYTPELTRNFEQPMDCRFNTPKRWNTVYSALIVYHTQGNDEASIARRHGGLGFFVRRVPADFVYEFDTMADFEAFDPNYLAENESPSINFICEHLNCTPAEIEDPKPLSKGYSNLSCVFTVRGEKFVFRKTDRFDKTLRRLSRETEARAEAAALDLGIDRTFLYEDPETGWKLSRYIEGVRLIDPENDEEVAQGFELVRRLHASDDPRLTSEHRCDWMAVADHGEMYLLERNYDLGERYMALRAKIQLLFPLVRGDGEERITFCHNDVSPVNFLVSPDGSMDLVDWEYAAYGDAANDLANFCNQAMPSPERFDRLVELFLDRTPRPEEYRHLLGVTVLCNWAMADWALLTRWPAGGYATEVYGWMDQFIDRALALYGVSQDADAEPSVPLWIAQGYPSRADD